MHQRFTIFVPAKNGPKSNIFPILNKLQPKPINATIFLIVCSQQSFCVKKVHDQYEKCFLELAGDAQITLKHIQVIRRVQHASKNWKLQTLGASTFGDHTVTWISIMALKWTNFTFFRVSQKGCTKNTKNSVLKRAIRNYPTKLPRKVEAINTWTF